MFKKTWDKCLDILFPQICLNCKTFLEGAENKNNLLCHDCLKSIAFFKTSFRLSPECRLFALGPYEDVVLKKLIHHFKYKSFRNALTPIEPFINIYLEDLVEGTLNSYCIVVPIPLHKTRLRERGFNQSLLIAEIIGEKLNLKVVPEALKRIKNTKHQTEIQDDIRRKKNVLNCFAIDEKSVRNKSVLLVDDVYTSGATINEAVKMFRHAGAKEINVFVLAKTR
ncbi:ComF family protein [Patescibacteria group bacterium]|nr:ComF family protein [Patescibacteria group bacterium]